VKGAKFRASAASGDRCQSHCSEVVILGLKLCMFSGLDVSIQDLMVGYGLDQCSMFFQFSSLLLVVKACSLGLTSQDFSDVQGIDFVRLGSGVRSKA